MLFRSLPSLAQEVLNEDVEMASEKENRGSFDVPELPSPVQERDINITFMNLGSFD